MKNVLIGFSVLLMGTIVSCKKGEDGPGLNEVVFSATGNIATIKTKMDEFRLAMGTNLNVTVSGADPGGRREISWDDIPSLQTNTNNFPADFFASTDAALPDMRKSGFQLIDQLGTIGFRVDSSKFSQIDPSYSSQISAFSGIKTFANLNDNVTEAEFKVPGTNNRAYVKGVGIVFVDVDDNTSTTVEFFNEFVSFGIYQVPAKTSGSNFSFLGVQFPDEEVLKVRIMSGNGKLAAGTFDISTGSSSNAKDIVVIDDVIYSEPKQF